MDNTHVTTPADETTDEEQARKAREQYREAGLPLIEADETIAPLLAQGEHVIGCWEQATLSRVDEATQSTVHDKGVLYVTNRRLVHVATSTTSLELGDVQELAMADNRILVTLAGARGVMLDVPSPRQLRVLIGAARSVARG